MVRIALIAIALSLASPSMVSAKSRLLVFAAASLKNVLEEIGKGYETHCRCEIVFSFASSGTLARQVDAGAPANIFISADSDWMEWLRSRNAIQQDTIRNVAENRLVLVVSKDSIPADTPVTTLTEISELLATGRIAMAEVRSVPAGRYGMQALQNLGIWQQISNRIVYGENVRISLSLVARQDVNAAIVYFSDTKIEPRVKIAYIFEESSHEKIVYPAGLVKANKEATEFMKFLISPPARHIFAQFGFSAGIDDR